MQVEIFLNKIFRIMKIIIICAMRLCRWLRGSNVSVELVVPVFTVKAGIVNLHCIALDAAFSFGKGQQFYQRYIKTRDEKTKNFSSPITR